MEIGSTLSTYRVLSRLGAGGMGEVYLAEDSTLQREVALKVLPATLLTDPTSLSRFEREAKLLASVNHPNIATIHGIEEADGIRFLVLELVSGESLAERLTRGPLPIDKALRLTAQVADALQAAHKRDIVHRDLKPANIMITEDGWAKVLDFGLAKTVGDEPLGGSELEATLSAAGGESLDLTAAGMLLGTVPYMSPEQARGQPVDWRSDVWAFGCVAFEALTGRRAFERPTPLETLSAILEASPDWRQLPAELPAGVRRLIGRCLQKDPDRRLHAMADARIELEEALHDLRASTPPDVGMEAASSAAMPPAALGYLDTLGAYTVVERLDVGGVGEVYRARDRQMDRDVALKVLRPGTTGDEARERFRREAQMLSRLDHPRVAALYAFDSSDGIDYMATEYVAGESLAERLGAGPLSERDVASLGAQVAEGLEAVHQAGILHRDLKPGNVQIAPDGQVKLVDFGLAEEREGAVSELSGPLPYAAPELLRDEPIDQRGDLYSLGVVLYQMATGERPFRETSVEQLSESILREEPRPPSALRSGLSPELDAVILRCLAKSPEERYDSAAAVARDLAALAPGPAAKRRPAARMGRAGRRVAIAAAGAAALVLAILLATWLWDREAPPAAGPAPIQSLVVLPGGFTGPESDEFLSDAVANSVTTRLAGVAGLDARVPPTRHQVVEVGEDLARIAEAFDVEALVVSEVQADGDRLTLSLRLLEADDLGPIWSDRFEGGRGEFGELARRAAEGVLGALRREGEAAAAGGGSPAAEIELQQAVFYAKLFVNRGRPGDFERARAAYDETLAIDPGNAAALAGMAALHLYRLNTGASPLEVAPEAESWARRALEADPRSGRAWAALSVLESGRSPESYRDKLQFALKAAAFEPREASSHRALSVTLGVNSCELGIAAARQGTRQDPLVINSPLIEATYLMQEGSYAEGLERVEEVLAVEPDWPFALLFKALSLNVAGREAESAAMLPQLEPLVERQLLHPAWLEAARDVSAFGLAVERGEGESATAVAARQRLLAAARGETPFPRWQVVTAGYPLVLARHGYPDLALDILRFREQNEIQDPLDLLLFNPDLESVRRRPEFAAVLERPSSRFDAMVGILEEAQARGELPRYLERPLADLLPRIRAARIELQA